MGDLLLQKLTLRELGSKHVMTLGLESSLDNAISIMKDFDFYSIPILNGSEFIGVVDGKTILDEFSKNPYSATLYSKIEDINFKEVEAFPVDITIQDCAELLLLIQDCIPTLDNDILFSLITPRDLIGYNFIWTRVDDEVFIDSDIDYNMHPHLIISEDSSFLNLINQMSNQSLDYIILIEPDTKLWKGVISIREIITEIFRQTKFSDSSNDFLYRIGLFTLIHHPNSYFSSPPKIRNIRFVMNEHDLSVVPLVDIEGNLRNVVTPKDLIRKLLE